MKRLIRFLLISVSLCHLPAAFAQSETRPLWEIGAGVGGINLPQYRGAQERRSYLLPIPYFVYRGEHLQVSRDRMRGLIFRRDRVEMDVSMSASLPARSKDSIARRGMPDLNLGLEIGPSLNTHLYYSEDKKLNLDLRMPLRSATAIDVNHSQNIGWLFQPQLDLDIYDIRHSGWNIGVEGGLIFSDQRYQQYFYDVAPQYVTATRPAYTAGGGYSGTQFILFLNKQLNGQRIAGFIKWDNLDGASFADSPLVARKQNFSVGFAVTWILDKSAKMVEVSND
jgi:outer membrane scaffolding protein for murein synthesis (MipA/OmpV family)